MFNQLFQLHQEDKKSSFQKLWDRIRCTKIHSSLHFWIDYLLSVCLDAAIDLNLLFNTIICMFGKEYIKIAIEGKSTIFGWKNMFLGIFFLTATQGFWSFIMVEYMSKCFQTGHSFFMELLRQSSLSFLNEKSYFLIIPAMCIAINN